MRAAVAETTSLLAEKKSPAAVLLAAVLAASPALAGPTMALPPAAVAADASQFLQPEDNYFESYRATEARVFKEAFAGDVVARAMVEPSFQSEFALGLIADHGGYKLILLEAKRQIWPHTPPHPENLPVARCQIRVPAGIGHRILEAWTLMLDRTVPTNQSGLDGVINHFALRDGGRERAGQTWSPVESTNPGRLVAITDAMRNACRATSAAPLSSIPALADAIRAHQGSPP